jgi:hypothetical protein
MTGLANKKVDESERVLVLDCEKILSNYLKEEPKNLS